MKARLPIACPLLLWALTSGCTPVANPGLSTLTTMPSQSQSREQTIVLDWGGQIRGYEGPDKDGRDTYTPVPDDVVPVKVCVLQKTTPIFDSASISNDRHVILQLLPGSILPHHPQVRTVQLRIDLPHYINDFFTVGKFYMMRFTNTGSLFDVIDENGRSGLDDGQLSSKRYIEQLFEKNP